MGSSGSGKTTLLNLISTIDKPTSGKIILGENIVLPLTLENVPMKKQDEKLKKVIKLLKGTKMLKPEPKSSLILAVFCVVLLVYAYYMAVGVTISDLFYKIAPVTFMIIIATYSYWMDRLNQVEAAYPQAIFYASESSNLSGDNVYKDVDYNDDYRERVGLLESLLEKDKISYDKVEGKIKTIVTENTDKTVKIIKESDYIKLSKEKRLETIELESNEVISLSKSNVSKVNINNKNNNVMTIDNKYMKVKYADKSVMPAYYGAYVVEDDFYNSISLDFTEDKFIAIDTKDYMKTLGAIKGFEDIHIQTLEKEEKKALFLYRNINIPAKCK